LEAITFIGLFVHDAVLKAAGLLINEAAPGFVAFVLVLLLIAAMIAFWLRVSRQRSAARWLRMLIAESPTGAEFSRDIDQLTAKIQSAAKMSVRWHLAEAWSEYRETFVLYEEDGTIVLRNAVRPSTFLNVEDLGFSPGFWRIVPGLFVTVGLFLTFLGLISALNTMSQGGTINSGTMQTLLKIASAKFIMSLTGLFCSIVFTIFFRAYFGQLERSLHSLCSVIEGRLTYISLEALAAEQLRATREQREHFRLIGMELVAELGRPLREELPAAISASISGAMAPIMDKVGKLGAEGVGDIVTGLSGQLTDTVGLALSEASQRLSEAGAKIGQLAERMDQSSGRMGSEMEGVTARVAQAVEDLRASMSSTAETAGGAFTQGAEKLLGVMNQTLEGIRDNTGEGARAMAAAANDMRLAAVGFRDEMEAAAKTGSEAAQARMQAASIDASGSIGVAGQGVADAFGKTSAEIARLAQDLAQKAGEDLMSPMSVIATKLEEMVSQLSQGTADMRRMAEGVRSGAEASTQAAGAFRGASNELTTAATPIRAITERIEASIRQLTDSTQHAASVVSRSAETTAESAAATLATAQQVLGQEARAIESALSGVTVMLERMRGQGDRLDDIDAKLGKAFETYTDQVAKAVEGMFGHVREMQDRLNPALDTMREIVDQAEQFAPQSRRT